MLWPQTTARGGWRPDRLAGQPILNSLEARPQVGDLRLEALDATVQLALREPDEGARLLELPGGLGPEVLELAVHLLR